MSWYTIPPPLRTPSLRMLVESRLHSCVMLVPEKADDFNVRCDVVVSVVGVPRDDASRVHPAAKGTTRSKSAREKRKYLSMRREAGGKEQSCGARLRSELEVLL
jgi:hypothetical protein